MPSNKQFFSIITIATLLQIFTPLFILTTGWQWQPTDPPPLFLYPLYLLTETGTMPLVLLISVLLACIPLAYLKLSPSKKILCFCIIVGYLGAGQLVKEGMKIFFQEERPYVAWLEVENYISETDFYKLTRSERAEFVATQDFSVHHIPAWQQSHWSKETGYSFPSGHTIYAAQWIFLYVMLLWHRRVYLAISLMVVYGISMQISRLVLGMHWAIDVFVSCLLAAVLIYPAYLCYRKWILGTTANMPPAINKYP